MLQGNQLTTHQVLSLLQQLTFIYRQPTVKRNCRTEIPCSELFEVIAGGGGGVISDNLAAVLYFDSSKTKDKET